MNPLAGGRVVPSKSHPTGARPAPAPGGGASDPAAVRRAPAGSCGWARGIPRLLVLALSTLWAFAAADTGGAFHIDRVVTRIEGDTLLMDASIDYAFSQRALEALDNGVPLTLVVHVQLRRADDWVWNDSLVDQRLRYVIRYKPLSERYLVSRIPGEGSVSYVTRDAAIAALGEIEGLELVSLARLRQETGPFALYVKAFLDTEELPVPLRPIAYLLPSWKLSSGWTQWPLAP